MRPGTVPVRPKREGRGPLGVLGHPMGDFWESHGRPRGSHGRPWGSQLSSHAGETLVFHRKASFTCIRAHFWSHGRARGPQGRPWRCPGGVQKSPWDAQGTPKAPKMNSIEIGVKREGPKSEEKHGPGDENAFPMNARRKRDPAKHSPLCSKT